jgi:porphobilinogen deaminase
LLEGGCQMPLGVFTTQDDSIFETHVGYATSSDSEMMKFVETGSDAEAIIKTIVNKLKNETVHQS